MAPKPKAKVQQIKHGVPVHLFLKMEPTDLQKFGHDIRVTILADRRSPVGRGKHKKGPKVPKKGAKKN